MRYRDGDRHNSKFWRVLYLLFFFLLKIALTFYSINLHKSWNPFIFKTQMNSHNHKSSIKNVFLDYLSHYVMASKWVIDFSIKPNQKSTDCSQIKSIQLIILRNVSYWLWNYRCRPYWHLDNFFWNIWAKYFWKPVRVKLI